MLVHRTKERGDTLIEVLFAIVIFSAIAVGSLNIMNQGSSSAERALEITLTRQAIDAQARTLRFLGSSFNSAYQPGSGYSGYSAATPAGQWAAMGAAILATNATSASSFSAFATSCPVTPPAGSFILDTRKVQYIGDASKLKPVTANPTTPGLVYTTASNFSEADGIWIQAVRSRTSSDTNQKKLGYIDFHINACWNGPGQGPPITLGTIVRLYEPRG